MRLRFWLNRFSLFSDSWKFSGVNFFLSLWCWKFVLACSAGMRFFGLRFCCWSSERYMVWTVVCLVRPCLDDGLGCSDYLCLIGLLFAQVVRVAIVNLSVCLRLSATTQKDRNPEPYSRPPNIFFLFFLFPIFSFFLISEKNIVWILVIIQLDSLLLVFLRILLPEFFRLCFLWYLIFPFRFFLVVLNFQPLCFAFGA